MPQLTFPVTKEGLGVPVWVWLAPQAAIARQASGQSIPAPILARGLLDTGSNPSAVAPWVIQQLAITPATSGRTQTAAGLTQVDLYEVSLSITDPTRPSSPMLTHRSLLVSELRVTLQDTDVLIGLDVLLQCKLMLDGPGLLFTLDF
jgi:hypothetical protein